MPAHRIRLTGCRRSRRACGWLLTLSMLVAATGLAAQEDPAERERKAQETERNLQRLRADITAMKASLGERERAENTAVVQLAEAELAVSNHQRTLAEIAERSARHETDLATIAGRQAQARIQVEQQKKALAALLRLDYIRGRQSAGKSLLSIDRETSMSRLLGYSRLLRRSRLDRIEELAATLAELAQLQSEHDQSTAGLAHEREAAEQERRQLLVAVAEREAALDALRRDLQDQRQRLATLGRDEQQLQQLLDRLRDIFADLPATLDGSEPFARRRGQLSWPADGAVERTDAGLRIAAAEGTPVRAIGYGRVAYADWLRGYGLLLIIDHGDGYMSLYGHNEALLAAEGSWVQDGETIAQVGRSGGASTNALYFELRERGRSIDPRPWLRRR